MLKSQLWVLKKNLLALIEIIKIQQAYNSTNVEINNCRTAAAIDVPHNLQNYYLLISIILFQSNFTRKEIKLCIRPRTLFMVLALRMLLIKVRKLVVCLSESVYLSYSMTCLLPLNKAMKKLNHLYSPPLKQLQNKFPQFSETEEKPFRKSNILKSQNYKALRGTIQTITQSQEVKKSFHLNCYLQQSMTL